MVLALLVVLAAAVVSAPPSRASLAKPLYDLGDRWVYLLEGSLDGLPGFNASLNGTFQLELSGLVQVDIVGASPSGVRADTHASGFLNGTFTFPTNGTGSGKGNGTVHASGTFSSDASEFWEGQDYLPTTSNSSTGYAVDLTLVITVPALVNVWLNTTTSYASLPAFELGIGESASAAFASDLDAATSVSFFGFTQRMENRTSVTGEWTRHVLGLENVTVEAGTFSAYRLNESLGGFPGLGALPATGANETAWFSNATGSYVKRVAYANGTPVAEMRLKSYTYPAAAPGLSAAEVALFLALPLVAAVVIVFLLLRRRKARQDREKTSSGAGPVGELPPKRPGG